MVDQVKANTLHIRGDLRPARHQRIVHHKNEQPAKR
jgi:hypothetical protein